jgi:hypothetical protein
LSLQLFISFLLLSLDLLLASQELIKYEIRISPVFQNSHDSIVKVPIVLIFVLFLSAKKSQIIIMLLKIQNLRQEDVNNAMRDMLLGAQKQYKDQNNGYLHNGIMAVLKYWGDPDLIFN